jgi:hypothetical protein
MQQSPCHPAFCDNLFSKAREVISRPDEVVSLADEAMPKQTGCQLGDIQRGESTMAVRLAAIAVLAISLSAVPSASRAFSPEAQQMCTGDAFRLCSAEIPNVSRITACMMKQRASLSAGCRTIMDRDLAQQSKTTDSN